MGKMMEDAMELRSESRWLQTLAARLASTSGFQSLSAKELKLSLGVPKSFAVLLADYFNPQPAHTSQWLPSIPECSTLIEARRRRLACPTRRQRLPKRRVMQATVDEEDNSVEPCALANVDHLRELCPKDCRHRAGMRRVRNSRCAFTQLMSVVDGAGAVHRLKYHTANTMPRSLQRRGEVKWPSKAGLKRERLRERFQKTYYDRLPAVSHADMGW